MMLENLIWHCYSPAFAIYFGDHILASSLALSFTCGGAPAGRKRGGECMNTGLCHHFQFIPLQPTTDTDRPFPFTCGGTLSCRQKKRPTHRSLWLTPNRRNIPPTYPSNINYAHQPGAYSLPLLRAVEIQCEGTHLFQKAG